MSINLILGGEDVRNAADAVAAGLIRNVVPASASGQLVGGTSINGFPGRAFVLPKPYNGQGFAPWASNGPASNIDVGVFRLPKTIKQYWDAGGLAFSGRLRFNSGQSMTIAQGTPGLTQMCVDPATNRVYMIANINGVPGIYTTIDLGVTWSLVTPPAGVTIVSSTHFLSFANGYLCLTQHNTAGSVYSTNDQGATWQQTPTITVAGNRGLYGVVYTGDATWPYVLFAAGNGTSVSGAVLLSGLGPTATSVLAYMPGTSNDPWMWARVVTGSGYVVASTATGYIVFGNIAAGLQNASSWTTRRYDTDFGVGQAVYGVEFSNNRWFVGVGDSNGLYSGPNPGTLPAILPPAAATALTPVTRRGDSDGTNAMYALTRIGTELFACGSAGTTAYSADGGTTWTFDSCKLGCVSISAQTYNGAVASNDRFFCYSDTTAAMFMTSLHAGYGWVTNTVSEGGELGNSPGQPFGVFGTASLSAQNVPTFVSGVPAIGLITTTPSGNARTVQVTQSSAALISGSSINLPDAQTNRVRHWEVVLTADPSVVNSFFVSVRQQNDVVFGPTLTSYPLAPVGDTTSFLLLNIPINGGFNAFDDIVIVDFAGSVNNNPVGVSVILPLAPSGDVQAQWDRTGGLATNAASTAKGAPSGIPPAAYSGIYVSTSDVGDKDIYGVDAGVTAGDISAYQPRAVKAFGYFTRQGSSMPQVKVGSVVKGVETQSAATVVSGLTQASTIVETDNTVTVDDVLASRLTIEKTT